MEDYTLTVNRIAVFEAYLRREERAPSSIEKYLRAVGEFAAWLGGGAVTKEAVLSWKESLLARSQSPATVNGKLSALNGLFRCLGWERCRVKFLRLQRRVFRERSRELTREEYIRLLEAARSSGRRRLELLMESMCSTGIRVSELRYLTVEAARSGQAQVILKGKVRTILLPGKLCRKLLRYAAGQNITYNKNHPERGGFYYVSFL